MLQLKLHSVFWEPSRLKQLSKIKEFVKSVVSFRIEYSRLKTSTKSFWDSHRIRIVSLLSERGSALRSSLFESISSRDHFVQLVSYFQLKISYVFTFWTFKISCFFIFQTFRVSYFPFLFWNHALILITFKLIYISYNFIKKTSL